eukprot:IDg18541t1
MLNLANYLLPLPTTHGSVLHRPLSASLGITTTFQHAHTALETLVTTNQCTPDEVLVLIIMYVLLVVPMRRQRANSRISLKRPYP